SKPSLGRFSRENPSLPPKERQLEIVSASISGFLRERTAGLLTRRRSGAILQLRVEPVPLLWLRLHLRLFPTNKRGWNVWLRQEEGFFRNHGIPKAPADRGHQDPHDWSEPWILILVFFHVVCLFFTYLSFRHYRFQIGLFLSLIILVFCAEYINEAAAANWRFFSKQQNFDSQGMFISLVFSVPLLLNAILIVVSTDLFPSKFWHQGKRNQKKKSFIGENSCLWCLVILSLCLIPRHLLATIVLIMQMTSLQ
uniref:Transmembrane protein 18 n=1 Tax=Laticauda laticaudata TaxID=8630 RepID=A0A8C5S7N7_LATLA